MASLAVAAVGAGIGGFFFQSAALGWTIGSFFGSTLFGPGGQDTQGPRLQDLKVQSSAYGKDIPIVYGSARLAGNVIWSLPLRETAHEEDQGKGGGGSTVTTYTYDATFAVLLCEGPIVGVRKIWAYGELIYNLSDDASLETIIASNRAARSFAFYTGSETQDPDPLIQADLGAANTQAFRGYAYVVINRLQLEKYGNRIPELTFEVVSAGGSSVVTMLDIDTGTASLATQGLSCMSRPLDSAGGSFYAYKVPANLEIYPMKIGVNGEVQSYPPVDCAGYGAGVDVQFQADGNYYIAARSGGAATDFLIASFSEAGFSSDTTPVNPYDGDYTYAGAQNFTCNINNRILYTFFHKDYYGDVSMLTATSIYDEAAGVKIIDFSSVSDTPHTFTVGNERIYFLNSDDSVSVYSLDGDLISTTSFTPSKSIFYSHGGNGAVRVFADGPYIYILSSDGADFDVHRLYGEQYDLIVDGESLGGATGSSYYSLWGGSVIKDNLLAILSERGSNYKVFNLAGKSADSISLSAIQSDICQRAGLSVSDINVVGLTDDVTGYVIPRNMSGRSASEQLMGAYFYDPADIANNITFVKRGGASKTTLSVDDLGAHYFGSEFETISHERLQDPELPSEIVVKHIDENRAYQDGAQRSQRITHPVENISTTELSIVMPATKAKQIAEIWMQNAYTERDKYTFSLTRDFIDLNPTDVITVPTGGGNRDLRITKITYAPVMDIEAVADSPYTSTAEAGEGDAIGGNVNLLGPTNLLALDIPLLRNADNDEGLYLAANGYFDSWPGAQVFTSNSETDGYTPKTSIFNDAVIGIAKTALADSSPYDWDRVNTVTIQLFNGDLSSITEDQVSQGGNYFLLGNEIGQYANATLNADGSYTLDTLTRGRRGTEWATGSHAIGERFVLIGSLTLKRIDQAYNSLKYYKAATFGTYLDEAEAQSLTNTGVSLKPFSPYQLSFALDGSNNLTGSWQARSRYIAPTFRDLPLFESSEEYEIDIVKAGVVLATKTVTAKSLSYTSAQQVIDGLTAGDFDTIRVYQISETVGRGYVAEYTL